MPEMQNRIKRQIAHKVRIKDILNGNYTREDGWQPNYIEINGKKISRVNLIGTVVLKIDKNDIILDDGSGKITVRIFENNGFFKKIDVGDAVLLIGRPREFGSEKYIFPEIVKRIENPMWINVRKMELKLNDIHATNFGEDKVIEEERIGEMEDTGAVSDKIFNLIKNLDNGEGVDIEEVLENIKDEGAEETINKLLENGEIFEIKSGRLKVLE